MGHFFGLDIGSTQVRALQASKVKEGFKLEHFHSQSYTEISQLAETIKATIKAAGINSSTEVNVALPESDAYTRIIQVPKLSSTELASSIHYEAEQYVPVPLTEVELYHQVLDDVVTEEQKTMRVLLIAVTKVRLSKLTSLLDQADLMPKSLETELFAQKRLFADRQKNQVLLHMGFRSTDIMILNKGTCLFLHSLSSGAMAMTKTLVNELSLTEVQAEEYKKTYGVRDDLLEGKVANLLKPLVDAVVDEINKSIIYLNQQGINQKPEQVVISGGGALLPGLDGYLVEKLNMEVVTADPFNRFVKDEHFKKMVVDEKNPQLATVAGLALKGLN